MQDADGAAGEGVNRAAEGELYRGERDGDVRKELRDEGGGRK
jgi:hypothetical protein